jgi:hypothetical protein
VLGTAAVVLEPAVLGIVRERERERARQRDRQRDRQTERERERERQTDRQTDRARVRARESVVCAIVRACQLVLVVQLAHFLLEYLSDGGFEREKETKQQEGTRDQGNEREGWRKWEWKEMREGRRGESEILHHRRRSEVCMTRQGAIPGQVAHPHPRR